MLINTPHVLYLNVPQNSIAHQFRKTFTKIGTKPLNLETQYEEFKNFFDGKKDFFCHVRNMVGHYDHERTNYYFDFIATQKLHELTECYDIITDSNSPLHLELIMYIYRDLYKDDTKNINDEELIAKIINDYKVLMGLILNISKRIMNNFWSEKFDSKNISIVANEEIAKPVMQKNGRKS